MPLSFPWQSVHFIGIGGVGMSGMATILLDARVRVTGSDMAASSFTRRLGVRGVRVCCEHAAENVPADTDVVVFSSAVTDENPEMLAAARLGIRRVRRGEFLAELAQSFPVVVSVAGSHGKTTTTAMLAHILRAAGKRPGYMVGGEVVGWYSPAGAGAGRVLITEVDESDGTQAAMRSTWAVITNIEDDHCWSVGGVHALESCFAQFANRAETVLAWDTPETRRILPAEKLPEFLGDADIPTALALRLPGQYNRRNAALAVRVATALGVPEPTALQALAGFGGAKRRMTLHYRSGDEARAVIEDYAHHPTELQAFLEAVRAEYPEHCLVAVFQPHRYERIKRYAEEFARILGRADSVVVTQPFAAWRSDDDIADPARIAEAVRDGPSRYFDGTLESLADELIRAVAPGEKALFTVIGAGTIAALAPALKRRLTDRELDELADELSEADPDLIVIRNRPWSRLTTLGIGSACPLLVRPATLSQLRHALRCAKSANLSILIAGAGSNLVGSDQPARALVIQPRGGEFDEFRCDGDCVVAGAGLSLYRLCRKLLSVGRLPAKAAALAWIPGVLGGSVRMNAGAHGAAIADVVERIEGVRMDGSAWQARRDQIRWERHATDLPEDVVVCRVVLNLPLQGPEASAAAAARLQASRGERRQTHPIGRSAGCVFRNPGTASAGKMLDEAGCRGQALGDCRISRFHANFIVNRDAGREQDFLDLAAHARRAVFDRTGVRLRPEVRCVNPETAAALDGAIEPIRVAVLAGGPSRERAVSLASGAAVARALREAGMQVHEIDVTETSLPPLPPDTEVVFPALHGTFGEDGHCQQLLEEAGLPYVGSGPEASALIMDKWRTKAALVEAGVPVPHAVCVSAPDTPMPGELSGRIVVKPRSQGSSVGMTCLEELTADAWGAAVAAALDCDVCALAEEYVAGTEMTVALLDGTPLPAVEILPPDGRLYDYDAKYEYRQGHTQYNCPPQRLSKETVASARDHAMRAWEALGARHLLRVDFRVTPEGQPLVLEANSLPGFTATSLMPKAAAQAGIGFAELCARLVRLALCD